MRAAPRVRAFASSAAAQTAVDRVAVIGGGQMGAGIAQVAATHKHDVTLVDVSQEALERGKAYMAKSLGRVAKKKFPDDAQAQGRFVDEVLSRVALSTSPAEAAGSAGLVIEAVVENIKLKQDIFAGLAAAAPEGAILASNTSSLPIAKISEQLSAARKKRFIGLHFFNPVPQMKLVEVVRTDEADQQAVDDAVAFVKGIGKVPAV
ncbi:hypothetical protein IWQ56_006506, partial [Coemansia nantahalensis]